MQKIKIYCLAGLPGSGKTYLGMKISEKENAILIDDISSTDHLAKVLEENRNIVIADPHFCNSKIRNIAELFIKKHSSYAEIIWIYFENNPQKCLNNVEYRNDGRKVKIDINILSKIYLIPKDIKPLSIWQSK